MSRFKSIILFGALSAVLAGIAVGGVMGYWVNTLPRVESLQYYTMNATTHIYDRTGNQIGEFFREKRVVIDIRDLPQSVINTVLAAEDAAFFDHPGFDFPGIARALWIDMLHRKFSQGASTITQQVARLVFLNREKTLVRKIKEALLAVNIERSYSKEQILSLYLNYSYFGHGAYGIEVAAETYFQKNARSLSIPETATLMAVLNNPTFYNPENHPDRTLSKRNAIIRRMVDARFISPAQFEKFSSEPLNIAESDSQGGFAAYYLEEIRKQLVDRFGSDKMYSAGLQVHTTLDSQLQEAAEYAIAKGVEEFQSRQPDSSNVQAALVTLQPGTSDVLALVGGVDFRVSKFNRARQAVRQSGSSIKPFVYLTALIQGYQPNDIIVDAPIYFIDPHTRVEYRPKNFDHKFHGPVTFRTALEKSYNVPTVKLLEKIGIDNVRRTASEMGIESQLPPYLSMGLGSGEVTLLELTNAYNTLNTGGLRATPRWIQRVYDNTGTLVWDQPVEVMEVFDAVPCYQITRILEGAVQNGSAWRARRLNRSIAAKTGTTNENTDAWFMGYSPTLTAGVWVGYDVKRSLGRNETGSRAAGPIFVDFMEQALAGTPDEEFMAPKGVTEMDICHESGLLSRGGCPNVILEVFRVNQGPSETCNIHSTGREQDN